MENNVNVKDLFGLEGLMKLFNTTDIASVVALEKKLINFLTQEQLEEIAKYEKEILNDLVNSKNSLEDLRAKYSKLVDKLGSIGINANDIINPPHEDRNNEEDLDLPKKVEIDFDELNFDEYDTIEEYDEEGYLRDDISEYLSDNYDYLVENFVYHINEDDQVVYVEGIVWNTSE